MKTIKKTMQFLSVPLLCGLGVFILFRFVLFLGYVPSASMEPTISTDSLIIGNRLYGELQRGDIVIFERNGTCLVKRIAAIPGDIVYLEDQTHTVSVNVETENATRCWMFRKTAISCWGITRRFRLTVGIGKILLYQRTVSMQL